MKIKEVIKNNKFLLDSLSIIYSFWFRILNLKSILNGTLSVRGAFIKNCKISIHGRRTKIIIGRRARLKNCHFFCNGIDTQLIIGGGKTVVSNTSFHVADDNSKIIIDNDFTMEGGHIASTEGKSIIIGNDCMFSNNIEIRNGDSHSILKNGVRINHAMNTMIGNHVWLCAGVKVMKGSVIPDGCIIGNSSMIAGICDEPDAIYAGIPAKKLKNNISWDRKR